MPDLPPWLALSLVLGLLIDALVPTGDVASWVDRRVTSAASRWEFAFRRGFPGQPATGGLTWVLALAFVAWSLAFFVQVVGTVLPGFDFGPFGRLLAESFLFFVLFSLRRRVTLAGSVQGWLEADRPDKARRLLQRFGPEVSEDEPAAVAGATVRRVGEGTAELAGLVAFWGMLGGPPLAAAAVALRVAVDEAQRGENPDDPFWRAAMRAARVVLVPAAWLAALSMRFGLVLVGGMTERSFEAFLAHEEAPPAQRLGHALVAGMHLGPAAGGERRGKAVVPSDIARSVVVLWATAFGVTFAATAGRAILLLFV